MARNTINNEESTRRPRKMTLADKRKGNNKYMGYQTLCDIIYNGAKNLPKH